MEISDLTLRLEKEFALTLQDDWHGLGNGTIRLAELTADQLHQRICAVLHLSGRPVPHSSWHRVKRCIARSLGIPVKVIQKDSRLWTDLRSRA